MSATTPSSALAEAYAAETARLEQEFESTGDGARAVRERSRLVDRVVLGLYADLVSADLDGPEAFSLVGVGGYGRQELFPHSDVDLLFVAHDAGVLERMREGVSRLARSLWDMRLRVGHSARTLAECGQLHGDNLEFSISLLDCRHLAGDPRIFRRLKDRVIPQLVARDRRDLVNDLVEMTRRRHQKYGSTIFHLEPNLKEAPGGLRDAHVSRWLSQIAELDRSGRWVEPEGQWPSALRPASLEALNFLAAARCFLHARKQRDDNVLTYELQEQAAAAGIGAPDLGERQPLAPADWMRGYFRRARAIQRLSAQILDEAAPSRTSLYGLLQGWRSHLSNADFSVVRGRLFPRRPAAGLDSSELLFALFEMVARHGLELSREAERWTEEALGHVGERLKNAPGAWGRVTRILVLPHAPEALRAMHRVGMLVALFPEFRAIDALVIRDFYHRYTVDEHSFMTIQNLQELGALGSRPPQAAAEPGSSPEGLEIWQRKLAGIFAELERPELLLFALLFHDVGKGMPVADHARGSLEALDRVLGRLAVRTEDRETIAFLIARHLEMSATLQRRDIFDPDVVRAFADKVGVEERLKMLCLLTYADIKAVNPDALTPWKAEMLWQLYASTSNYLTRGLDEQRVRASGSSEGHHAKTERVRALLAASDNDPGGALAAYLEGFPKRYLETHTPEKIAEHYRMAERLADRPVGLAFAKRSHWWELTVVTVDRPFLFASLTGTLAAWGMNILKADAFGNAAGLALDTFRFADLYRTLELNPSEVQALEQSVVEVLTGQANVSALVRRRGGEPRPLRPKVEIPTRVRFDDASSAHSTLVELITQDRPGLLYQVSTALAELGCNIEVALIDTEGEKVVDVFYLTAGGLKLDPADQQRVQDALLERLAKA